jgi:hypothetical protein
MTTRAGTWIPEEDAKLIEGVTELGNDWVRVATRVPGRTYLRLSAPHLLSGERTLQG